MTVILEKSIAGVTVKTLTAADEAVIQALLESCGDYSQMVYGRPPLPGDAAHLLAELPPEKSPDDKRVYGIFKGSQMIAILDILANYQKKGYLWIGLLLIDPDFRGKGMGKTVLTGLQTWARETAFHEIRIVVLEENRAGVAFWQKMGFREVENREKRQFGDKNHTILIMAKPL